MRNNLFAGQYQFGGLTEQELLDSMMMERHNVELSMMQRVFLGKL